MTDIDHIEEKIAECPLYAIDNILVSMPRGTNGELATFMALLTEAINTHLNQPIDTDPMSLFGQDLSRQDRRFIGICLVRLLASNDYYLEQNKPFRFKAFAFLDDVISHDLYKEFEVDSNEQTFKKAMKLKDAAPKAELRMREAVDSLRSLDRLAEFQADFMSAINSHVVRAIMWPFLPRSLVYKSRLQEVFSCIRKYRQANRKNVLEAFDKADGVIGEYLHEAEHYDTIYCQKYLVTLAKKLQQLLEQDFYNSDVGQPAELSIRPLSKKYPFHIKEQDLSLGFKIENQGPGYAFEVELNAESPVDNVVVSRPNIHLGRLEPGLLTVDFPAYVDMPEAIAFIEINVQWRNADRSLVRHSYEFVLQGQRTDIDWNGLSLEDPYSLEPIETHDRLVGREETMKQLLRQSRAKRIGSSYIYGQKRVGKTSIAKALQSILNVEDNMIVAYLEGGEYIGGGPQKTLNRLGTVICRRIKKSDGRLADIAIPEFSGALYPLSDFLEDVQDLVPSIRVLIILDEFDELPADLYRRGPLGDAFFLTIRTISGKPPFGFALVGGEKMDFIKSCQGDTFNKFWEVSVNYFDKEEHWADFQELVRGPTRDWLEITDEAVLALYEQTAGNPYFTICICREFFRLAVNRRDCYITDREINEKAVPRALRHIGTGFYHFWEDGIFESTGVKVEEISIRRRRILLALAQVLREKRKASKEDIVAKDVTSSIDSYTIENELRRFVQRRVLTEQSDLYDCKVPFFRTWLENAGMREILTTFSDLDAVLERQRREEIAYVQSEEIVELASSWGLYQGKRITEDHIRAWLKQFGDYIDQRLVFKILQKLKFYTEDLMRQKMKEAHGIVQRGLVWRKKPGQRKRGDIVVSYLDSPGKSGGGIYAKRYADENGIYYKNVIERSRLAEVLPDREDIKALVFIDDFIGTGGSAKKYFRELVEEIGHILHEADLRIYFVAITGFQESQSQVENTLEHYNLPIEVHICDPLDSSAKCFDEKSNQIFTDETERVSAMRLVQEHGARIVRRNPLGYGNCQTAIVFSDSCPNNNLPILWAESDEPPWQPLFKRPMPRKTL